MSVPPSRFVLFAYPISISLNNKCRNVIICENCPCIASFRSRPPFSSSVLLLVLLLLLLLLILPLLLLLLFLLLPLLLLLLELFISYTRPSLYESILHILHHCHRGSHESSQLPSFLRSCTIPQHSKFFDPTELTLHEFHYQRQICPQICAQIRPQISAQKTNK